jgi:hypothetical protein
MGGGEVRVPAAYVEVTIPEGAVFLAYAGVMRALIALASKLVDR